jgi:hypothetical protein
LTIIPEYVHSLGVHVNLVKMMQQYTDNERRMACMKALLAASKYEYFKNDFYNSGLMDVLVDIIAQESGVGLEIREFAFNIISNLCRDHRNN